MSMTGKKCANDTCECEMTRFGYAYCSPNCEEDAKGLAEDMDTTECRCGHAGCGSAKSPSDEEDVEQHV